MGTGDESCLARGRVGGQLLRNGMFDLKQKQKQKKTPSKQATNETGKDEETGNFSFLPWARTCPELEGRVMFL